MNWLRRAVIVVLAAVVASVGVGIWQINEVATRVVEEQGSKALGVDTTIEFISLGFLPPSLRIGGFEIENPEGFSERNFLTLRSGSLKTDMASLFEDVIVARSLRLDGVDLTIERELRRSNYGVILDNLKKTDSGADSAPSEASGGPGKRFRIDEIVIRNARAKVAIAMGTRSRAAEVLVPEIRLEGVGSGSGGGAVAGQVINNIIVAMLEALARQGSLPADLAGDMLGELKGLHRVGFEVSGDVVQRGDDLLDASLDRAGDTLGDATDAAGDAARKTTRGLRKLIPGRD